MVTMVYNAAEKKKGNVKGYMAKITNNAAKKKKDGKWYNDEQTDIPIQYMTDEGKKARELLIEVKNSLYRLGPPGYTTAQKELGALQLYLKRQDQTNKQRPINKRKRLSKELKNKIRQMYGNKVEIPQGLLAQPIPPASKKKLFPGTPFQCTIEFI